jgi:hypothetical protein
MARIAAQIAGESVRAINRAASAATAAKTAKARMCPIPLTMRSQLSAPPRNPTK